MNNRVFPRPNRRESLEVLFCFPYMLKCCLFFTISYKFTSFSKIFQLPRPRAPLCDASCARARSSPRLPATHSRCTPRFSPPFNALPPGRPSVAQSAEVRNAVPPRSALPGLSVAHPSTRLLTHFHPNGLLWHFSRKCVTPCRPEPPFQAPPGRIPSPALQRTSTQTAFCGTFRGSA